MRVEAIKVEDKLNRKSYLLEVKKVRDFDTVEILISIAMQRQKTNPDDYLFPIDLIKEQLKDANIKFNLYEMKRI